MENLRLTHKDWYALDKWERDTWLARELDRENTTVKIINSIKDKQKNSYNANGINAVLMLRAGLI